MKIVELSKPGQVYSAHIHVAGCATIDRDVAKGYTDRYDMDTDGPGWLEITFGDVSGDEYEPGSPQWRDDLRFQALEVRVMPCAERAGFTLGKVPS